VLTGYEQSAELYHYFNSNQTLNLLGFIDKLLVV
jgi:hypothetical protein